VCVIIKVIIFIKASVIYVTRLFFQFVLYENDDAKSNKWDLARVVREVRYHPEDHKFESCCGSEFTFRSDLLLTARGGSTYCGSLGITTQFLPVALGFRSRSN
jgi:hypothetical protein